MDLKTRYVVKGIGKEQVIQSKVNIFMNGGKISKVQDKWDGQLPEGGIRDVSNDFRCLLRPLWWVKCLENWTFWGWSFVWEMWIWRVRCLLVSYLALSCLSCV